MVLPVLSMQKKFGFVRVGGGALGAPAAKAMFLDVPRRIRNFLKGPSWAPAPTKRFFHSLIQGDTQSAPPCISNEPVLTV